MSTIECPKCKKHGKIKPIEHPSNKDKPYFKCEDCGALFDEESDLWKILGLRELVRRQFFQFSLAGVRV